MGRPQWEQCKNDAVVMLTAQQVNEKKGKFPACLTCWNEAKERGVKIFEADPIPPAKETKA